MLGVSMDIDACFAADYGEARDRFRIRAAAAGGVLRDYRNPSLAPDGSPLHTDAAWFGPATAPRVLVLVSATHGVEGFCGSAAQVDWITAGGPASLPDGTAVLLVHAINPYGFAWLRRTTEDGVDLNRNGIDFAKAPPVNPGYEELASAFVPDALNSVTLAAADERLHDFRARHGQRAFDVARSAGQYTHPLGLFYGGTGPTWSMRTIATIVSDHGLDRRGAVAVVDYHTGLGPFGYGEPIVGHRPGTPGQARCRAWYGASLSEPLLGTSSSVPIDGLTQYAWDRLLGDDRLTFIAIEFGTFPPDVGTAALRADHWLHAQGPVDWSADTTRRIKADLRRFYDPAMADWRELVLLRSRQIIDQALAGLGASHP